VVLIIFSLNYAQFVQVFYNIFRNMHLAAAATWQFTLQFVRNYDGII